MIKALNMNSMPSVWPPLLPFTVSKLTICHLGLHRHFAIMVLHDVAMLLERGRPASLLALSDLHSLVGEAKVDIRFSRNEYRGELSVLFISGAVEGSHSLMTTQA